MNKTAIKNFAVWARNKLIADITYRAGLVGVSDKGIAQPLPQSSKDLQFFDIGTKDYAQIAGKEVDQRKALVKAIQDKEHDSDYATAFKAVIEEVAYTWFNRLIAIRFMEVNDYLPSRIRVLSSENQAKNEPDFVTTPFDTDMEFTTAEQDTIMQLKDENKLDDLFRMLFIKQCNKLHEILPELFGNTNDYTELLLSISFTDSDGIVYHLVHDIDEDDFNIEKEGQVEIIGWMYQFYNAEPKDELINAKKQYKKEDIPFVTQLFTSDWIVKYMVENTLGRLWVEGHPNNELKDNWKYYLEESEQEADVQAKLEKIRAEYRNLTPEDIKIIDPCMGSGHILVYCFDVLMQIYESQGYTQRDAVQLILENNLFGLDIDNRATQLSYFAVMMKARQYDRRIFGCEIVPHIFVFEDSSDFNRNQLKYFGAGLTSDEKKIALKEISYLLEIMDDAKEFGSILEVSSCNWDLLRRFADCVEFTGQLTLETIGIENTKKKLLRFIEIGKTMSQKYDVVVTNPPYMTTKYMTPKIKEYVSSNYTPYKADLFAAFIVKCNKICKNSGHIGMLTPYVWMFIQSYEKLRKFVYNNMTFTSIVQLEYNAFEAACVPVAISTFRKNQIKSNFEGIKLSDFKGAEIQAPKTIEAIKNINCKYRYTANQEEFSKIPGSPVAYWVSPRVVDAFANEKALGEIASPKQGLATTDNNRFVRLWHEVALSDIGFGFTLKEAADSGMKWFPLNKGGEYRKWYGNNDCIVNYQYDGQEIKSNVLKKYTYLKTPDFVVKNQGFYFMENGTWSAISSGKISVRYSPKGFVISNAGMAIYSSSLLKYIIAFMNSKCISDALLQTISQTLNFNAGDIERLPLIIDNSRKNLISDVCDECIKISKSDWDFFENSWDFAKHPLIRYGSLNDAYTAWENVCCDHFNQLKANEEELNRIFIDIYGLQDELTTEVEDKDVTVRKADLQRDIKSLLSYAVGCMFGRYSLDTDGLAYAGGEWDDSKYSTFIPDKDNCIPITDEPYFEDDIVGLFCAWLKKVYGEDTLEENLDFIAKALGNKGSTSREVIRNYFLNDFIKDHIKTYQKRPIYWLFDSGKQNGFKALVYMHRWDADTVGNLRVEYLHKTQRIYEREIQRMQETMDNSHDSREINKASKRKEKLQKQLKETKDYDTMLAHIALSRIDIDLDDGVKVNYEKVQTGRDGKKMQILAKI